MWNMKVTVIPIVIGVLGTVIKGRIQELKDLEIRGRVETIQTTALLRSARILSYIWVLSILYTLTQALIWDQRKSLLYPSFSYIRV